MGNKAKTVTLRFRAVNQDVFDAIKTGKKKVETRAATERYRRIAIGDRIILICGKNRFEKRVKNARVFKTISGMLHKYRVKEINPSLKSTRELENMYNSFPDYQEKIKKYGLIVLELK